jgi:hypothetical protein
MIRGFLVFLLLFGLANAEDAKQGTNEFRGGFTVTVPANRILDRVELGVKFSESDTLFAEEIHKSASPNDMIQVGSKDILIMRKKRKSGLKFQDTKRVSSSAVFYCFQYTTHVKSFLIEPRYYMKEGAFLKEGKTAEVFQLELIEVFFPGDENGKVVKTLGPLSFEIGVMNRVPVDYDVSKGKRLAVRLSCVNTEEMHVLHVPVAGEGGFPGEYHDGSGKVLKFYNSWTGFEYLLPKNQNNSMSVFSQLTDEINRYVRNNEAYGTEQVLEIPIKLYMKLAPEGAENELKVKVGPEIPESEKKDAGMKPEPEEKKKRRGLFSIF